MTEKRLYRTSQGAYVGGVCTGLAEYFELDVIVVRILAVMLALLTFGLACIVYLALWARIPLQPEQGVPYDITPESAESTAFGCVDCLPDSEESRSSGIPMLARLAVAAGLMLLFLAVSMNIAPMVPGTYWWQFWPLCLLMVGLCLIIIPIRTRYEAVWHTAGIMLTSISASILPMSLGIMSWNTIACAFENFWPLVLASVILFAVGLYHKRDAFLLGSAFCLVAFCILGLVFCMIPGEIEALLLQWPSGHLMKITVING